jgi:hypothetical protein
MGLTMALVRRPVRFAVVATAVEATQRSSEPHDATAQLKIEPVGLFKLLARLFPGGDRCELASGRPGLGSRPAGPDRGV